MPVRCRAGASSLWSAAAESAPKDRLWADPRVGLEADDRFARDAPSQDPLDVIEQLEFVDADERHGIAIDAGPAGPPDPVDVILGDHRQFEVDDVRERLDVEPACGHLGRDEDLEATRLEIGQRPNALRLALVAVDRRGTDSVAIELLGESVRAVLGPGEDERLVDPPGRDQVAQQLTLPIPVDHVDDMGDKLGRGVPRGDLDGGRVVEQAIRQATDLIREGRREKQVLTADGENGQDLADVPDEAHVEHPVCLIKDEDLDP